MKKTLLCICCALLGLLTQARAGDRAYDLDKVKDMRWFVGSEEAKGLLAENGFVVTDQQFKQIFAAYIGGGAPKFVTVDSAWHTYHVLLEDAVRSLEEDQARNQLAFSKALYAAARARCKKNDDVYQKIAQFAGVGLALQNPKGLEELRKSDRNQVEKPAAALTDGTGLVVPLFFKLPLLAERFRASSFYTRNESLRGYYMARQWYATCDFRQKSKEETEIALHLVMLVQSDDTLRDLHSRLSKPYDALLGPTDDADMGQYFSVAKKVMGKTPSPADIPANIDKFLKEAAKLPDPKVNDQILASRDIYKDWVGETKGFRLFGPRRLPSATVLQNTVDPHVKGRMFPSGLDFFASGSMLCDRAAGALRKDPQHKKYVRDIASTPGADLPESLHGEALAVLKLLQEPVPKTAAKPLQAELWRDKQLWTELGAWTEQRHTWALHTKLTVHYLGLTTESPGYVSPYPAFFRQLATLSRNTANELEKWSASPDPKVAAEKILACIKLWNRMHNDYDSLKHDDYLKIEEFSGFLEYYVANVSESEPTSETDIAKLLEDMTELAQKWRSGRALTDEDRKLIGVVMNSGGSAVDLLPEFADLCDSLAKIADKELAGTKLSQKDAQLIRAYGQKLARFHFYRGNSWLEPRDDFPLVTALFVSPVKAQTLYAGLSRPEAVYVIIDVDGQPVLHRGAVLSYREFLRPIDRPLDDEGWRTEVRKGGIPGPPPFTASFRATITEDEVAGIIRSGGVYEAVNNVPGKMVTAALVEALLKEEPENDYWLRSSLVARAGDEDIPALIKVLTHSEDEDVGEIAMCIAQLSWPRHRTTITELLHAEKIQHADCAAYIIAAKPESIDVDALIAGYKKQPLRTRRLYCYLLGKSGNRSGLRTLVRATKDENAGLRYQAAEAIGDIGVRDKAAVERLIALIEDPNEFVAEAAARSLFQLDAKEAAPAMLARLKKGVRGRNVTTSTSHNQKQAVFGGTSYSGSTAIMVLAEDRFLSRSSLGRWLIDSMAKFNYAPAKEYLEEMIRSNYGRVSFEALKSLDPEGHRERVVAAAVDTGVTSWIREYAIEELVAFGDESAADAIAPLLEETTHTSTSYNGRPWRICDAAAAAVATILQWEDPLPDRSDGDGKAALLKKARQWAKGRKKR